jgi:hypothetical protein
MMLSVSISMFILSLAVVSPGAGDDNMSIIIKEIARLHPSQSPKFSPTARGHSLRPTPDAGKMGHSGPLEAPPRPSDCRTAGDELTLPRR